MQTLIRKLSSRKFWIAVVGIIVGIAATFGIEANDYIKIAGLVTTVASIFSFNIPEGKADAAGAIPLILPSSDDADNDNEDIPEVGEENQ